MEIPQKNESIIVVGDYCRKDFLLFFSGLKQDFNIYFLEYSYRGELRNNLYTQYGVAIFWKDFVSAQQLLRRIKPHAVVFFFIESLNHVALLNACKIAGIKTFHLEHGFRDLEFQLYLKQRGISFSNVQTKKKIPLIVRTLTRSFFEMTRLSLPRSNRKFLSHYKKIRLRNSILDTFLQIKNHLRIADHYISFSPGVYKFHQELDGLKKDQVVSFVGLPYLDYMVNDPLRKPDLNNPKIVFIDSGFHIEESYGWTKESRGSFLSEIRNAVQIAGFELWIKKHPLDHSDFWNSANWNFVEDDEWFCNWKMFNIILGEYSTLMIPLASLSHTICFCFDAHPVKGYKISNFLIEGGVCKEIKSAAELSVLLTKPDVLYNIHKKQCLFKNDFLSKWLTALDGLATERFTRIIKMSTKEVF